MKKTSLILSCFSILFILGGGGCKTKSSGTSDLSPVEKEFREYFTDYKTLDEWIEIAKKNNYKEYSKQIDAVDIDLHAKLPDLIDQAYNNFFQQQQQQPEIISKEQYVLASQINNYLSKQIFLAEIFPPKTVFSYTEKGEQKSIFISGLTVEKKEEKNGGWYIYRKKILDFEGIDNKKETFEFPPLENDLIEYKDDDKELKNLITRLFYPYYLDEEYDEPQEIKDVKEAILNYLKNSPKVYFPDEKTLNAIKQKISEELPLTADF